MKPSPQNIEAATKLIELYESLALKDVIGKEPYSITGFGYRGSCLLCRSAQRDCTDCIYYKTGGYQGCNLKNNKDTFFAIETATTPEARILAYYNRAQHIRKVLEVLEKTFEAFPITINIESEIEARALYAIFNHPKNGDLLGNGKARKIRDMLREKYGPAEVSYRTDGIPEVIANEITYQKYYSE